MPVAGGRPFDGLDPDLVLYAGVEAFRSTDGGATFTKLNNWWDYYDDPVNKLHADHPGIHTWPHPSVPGQENWYLSTDGDRIRGSWLNYELAGGEGATGQWSAQKQKAEP